MIPAFLALACLPFPFLFYKYGASIRKKCKYAAQADAFMEKMRARAAAQPAVVESSDGSSHTASVEEEAEEEAHETEPRFQEMKTEKETLDGLDLEKIRTGRSTRSRRSVRTIQEEYYDNPYEIDRVHTRESFKPTRSRADSTESGVKRPGSRSR
jgi:hypothetical protein